MSVYSSSKRFSQWLFGLPRWKRWLLFAVVLSVLVSIFDTNQIAKPDYSLQKTTHISEMQYAKINREREEEKRRSDALYACQLAMKGLARDPEKADIPYVDVFDGKDVYMVAWGASTRMMRMKNGLGLEVAATGSCDVDKSTGQIISLTFNGKQVLQMKRVNNK